MLNFKNVNIACAVLGLLFFFIFPSAYFFIWFLILFNIWIALTAIGSFHIRWNYFLPAKHHRHSINKKVVSLTFDDGPNLEFTPKFLALLKQYDAKATFFCIGKNIEEYPTLFQQIVNEGHSIGNHSYAHTNNYGFLKTKEVIKDILKTQQLITKLTNHKNSLFRPPFGVTNPSIAKAIKTLNLQTIGWSVRSYDTAAKDAQRVLKKLKRKIKTGDIVLLHDTNHLSYNVLEQLLQWLKEENYKCITVPKLFKNEDS